MVALAACVPLESHRPVRQYVAYAASATAALALSAFAVVWILQRLPAGAPEFGRAPGAASRAAAPAPMFVADPRGALFDPGFLAGSPRSFTAQSPVVATGFQAPPPILAAALPAPEIPARAPKQTSGSSGLQRVPAVLSAALPAAEDASPAPKPSVFPLGETAPSPTPRPVQTTRIAPPAAPASPVGRVARTGRGAPPVAEAPPDNRNILQKLFGIGKLSGRTLTYASAESGVSSVARTAASDPSTRYDRWTAVYDLAEHIVYMPDGTRLEAHSGLGDRLDDPAHVSERGRGATPPHLYELAAREQLFHGVQALRLNPVGGGDIFGRAGLLAHSYMLGPNGDSNGCVSFKNYDAFLQAFQNGQVKRLAVVARLD